MAFPTKVLLSPNLRSGASRPVTQLRMPLVFMVITTLGSPPASFCPCFGSTDANMLPTSPDAKRPIARKHDTGVLKERRSPGIAFGSNLQKAQQLKGDHLREQFAKGSATEDAEQNVEDNADQAVGGEDRGYASKDVRSTPLKDWRNANLKFFATKCQPKIRYPCAPMYHEIIINGRGHPVLKVAK
uniref:Uncharacterized protein n=1 Tax=Oryza punctata TaxID=4537 RepID=A0A0E0JJE3_ORYPU